MSLGAFVLAVGFLVESTPLVALAAVDPSIISAVIAGGFMLLNSCLIWYLTHSSRSPNPRPDV